MYVCACLSMYACVVCMCVHVFVCVCACTCVCVHVCVHVYRPGNIGNLHQLFSTYVFESLTNLECTEWLDQWMAPKE